MEIQLENRHNTDSENKVQNGASQTPKSSEASFLSKIIFQRVFCLSLARLFISLNKIYQDFGAVHSYYDTKALYFGIISLVSLILPSITYAIYLLLQELFQPRSSLKLTCNQFVIGLLLIPWQIKRHLDGLYFSSQRLFSYKKPNNDDMEKLSLLNNKCENLEFFQDFYGTFAQVLLQLYILWMEINNLLDAKFLLVGELIGSVFCIFSMLVATRRRDDGPLTGFLSFVGWTSMFTSRLVSLALATTILRVWIIVPCFIHSVAFTIWIYRIAIRANFGIAQRFHSRNTENTTNMTKEDIAREKARSNGFKLVLMVFIFFGIPSLLLWPIMFELKKRKRPFIFLLVSSIENAAFLFLWFFSKQTNFDTDKYPLYLVVATTLIADLFIGLYVLIKPTLTDEIVMHDSRYLYTSRESFGMYYEFCNVVFRIETSERLKRELEAFRTHEIPIE